MTKSILKSLFLLLIITLSSCGTIKIIDPSFATHEADALTNPDPRAIVGMWFNYHNSTEGKVAVGTMLFRADGTGYERVALHGFSANYGTEDTNFPLWWKYDGGGWWTAEQSSSGGHPNRQYKYRTDGRVLLGFHDSSLLGTQRMVWERADDDDAVLKERSR